MEKASIKLTTNSWHYKLIKFVLGKYAPTPQNMHNLCPYFWLLIFSLLTVLFIAPFKLFYKGLIWIFLKFDNWLLQPAANNWLKNLSDLDMVLFFDYNYYWQYLNIPNKPLGFYSLKRQEILEKYLLNKGIKINSTEYYNWLDKNREIADKLYREKEREIIRNKKNKENKQIEFINKLDELKENVGKKITNNDIYKLIIKWTKRFVGILITLGGLFVTFHIVNFITKGILFIIQIWKWSSIFLFLKALGIALLFIATIFFIIVFVIYAREKYNDSKKLWYIQVLYYIFLYPFVLLFYHILYKFLFEFIIYDFLINFIIWGSLKTIGKWFMNFIGIFGEYIKADYSDYCPGIEWKDEN